MLKQIDVARSKQQNNSTTITTNKKKRKAKPTSGNALLLPLKEPRSRWLAVSVRKVNWLALISSLAVTICVPLLIVALSMMAPEMANGMAVDHCYSDIGCFPLSEEFYHPRHRPFNVRPWHRRHIKTQFELFSARFPNGYLLRPWNGKNLRDSHFDARLETKIIVPGWLDNIDRALWVRHMKDALLWQWSPVNIIVVRWRNFTPYTIATSNSRVVGAELANMLSSIERLFNYDRAYFHIIGHSLGAHIGGYCGDRLPGLGRISALDPARPFFQHMPKSTRLDRGDAKFVDAIHSDFTPENAIFLLMSFGMTTPVGHVDFYPNGPPLLQPGCLRDTLFSVQDGIQRGLRYSSLSVAFLEATRYLTACDHQRSHEWFIESIVNRGCVFVGVRCNEYEGMINGRCTCDNSKSACAVMGIHADQMYVHNAHEDLWPATEGSRGIAHASTQPPPPVEGPVSSNVDDVPSHDHLQLVAAPPPTREQIYAQLKEEAHLLRVPREPSIETDASQVITRISGGGGHGGQSPLDSDQQETSGYDEQAAANAPPEDIAASLALDDTAFVDYLRLNLLPSEQTATAQQQQRLEARSGGDAKGGELERRQDGANEAARRSTPASLATGGERPLDGHPALLSDRDRDIETWYEQSSRWYLKTNNRQPYCANQYQLLVFIGPLRVRSGRDKLRANLVVSIIGSRGQLANQRFVPRSASLESHTMQPFFILLEGSYSLGQIRSIAIAWEARREPDPMKATVTFQSNALQELEKHVPVLRAPHPWLSKTNMFDHSDGYMFNSHEPIQLEDFRRRSDSAELAATDSQRQTSWDKRLNRPEDQPDQQQVLRRTKRDSNCAAAAAANSNGDLVVDKLGPADAHCSRKARESSQLVFSNKAKLERRQTDDGGLLGVLQMAEEALGPVLDPLGLTGTVGDDTYLDSNHYVGLGQALFDASLARPQVVLPQNGQYDPKFHMDIMEPNDNFLEPLYNYDPHVKIRPQPDNLQVDLSNLNPLAEHHQDNHNEDASIVVDRVLVSPLQATYGHGGLAGRVGKTFCSPRPGFRLHRDQTIKLIPSLTGKCHHNLPVMAS